MKDIDLKLDDSELLKLGYGMLIRGFSFPDQVQRLVYKAKSGEIVFKFCGINYLKK
jgi:hypothetical protein